jgi:hypothetical protein
MSAAGKAFETKLNILLGRLLSSELGIRATSEYIMPRDRPDIILYVNGVKIVLKARILDLTPREMSKDGFKRALEIWA